MSITDVRTRHVLVTNARNTLTNFFTLNAFNVSQHTLLTEVTFSQVVSRQRSSVVGRQSDQVVEDTRFTRCIFLEALDASISFVTQISTIVVSAHQTITIVFRNVFTRDRKSTRLNSS